MLKVFPKTKPRKYSNKSAFHNADSFGKPERIHKGKPQDIYLAAVDCTPPVAGVAHPLHQTAAEASAEAGELSV